MNALRLLLRVVGLLQILIAAALFLTAAHGAAGLPRA
jgi:hypothetical protein